MNDSTNTTDKGKAKRGCASLLLLSVAVFAGIGACSGSDEATPTATETVTVTEPTTPSPDEHTWTYPALNGDKVTFTYDPSGEQSYSWATDEDGNPTVPGPIDYIDSLGDDCDLLGLEVDQWIDMTSAESDVLSDGYKRMSAYAEYALDAYIDAGCDE